MAVCGWRAPQLSEKQVPHSACRPAPVLRCQRIAAAQPQFKAYGPLQHSSCILLPNSLCKAWASPLCARSMHAMVLKLQPHHETASQLPSAPTLASSAAIGREAMSWPQHCLPAHLILRSPGWTDLPHFACLRCALAGVVCVHVCAYVRVLMRTDSDCKAQAASCHA